MPKLAGGKFVILGGASQIGTRIAQHLLEADAREVVLLDNLLLGGINHLDPMLHDARCTFIRGDVLKLHTLLDPLDGADGVFMVAAFMASGLLQDPWTGLDVNIRGLQNALEACRLRGSPKIVISSSAGTYGALVDEPTDETAPLRWHELPPGAILYGASKVLGEGLARLYQHQHGLCYVALRYTAVYGERQHRRALVGGHIADSCDRIRRGLPPLIDGQGEQQQDYVYAGDVARANLLAMESEVSGEALNICSGSLTSQRRVVEIALQACGSDLRPEMRNAPTASSGSQVPRPPISHAKAHRLLGWKPQVSIENGVRIVLRWVDRQRDA